MLINFYYFINILSKKILLCYAKSLQCVRLCVTPEMAAHQAPLSLGFSKARTLKWAAISFSNA